MKVSKKSTKRITSKMITKVPVSRELVIWIEEIVVDIMTSMGGII